MADHSAAEDKEPDESVEYISRMTRELSRLATSSGQPFLAYILDMATEEASRSTAKPGLEAPAPRLTGSDAGIGRPQNET